MSSSNKKNGSTKIRKDPNGAGEYSLAQSNGHPKRKKRVDLNTSKTDQAMYDLWKTLYQGPETRKRA